LHHFDKTYLNMSDLIPEDIKNLTLNEESNPTSEVKTISA
jgi:hypothetical protein